MTKIGITTSHYESSLGFYSNGINKQYQEKILTAGGIPYLIPLHENTHFPTLQSLAEHYANDMDGLLIVGGPDVTPTLYAEYIQQDCGDFDYERDIWEIMLIKKFMAVEKPIFGICRGMQVINVALGGTLIQHMDAKSYDKHWHNIKRPHQKAHVVKVHGPRLTEILGQTTYVNSFHHQCINKFAPLLKTDTEHAYSNDVVPEAFYNQEHKLLGVQWHPEMLKNDEATNKLINFFLSLAVAPVHQLYQKEIS